MPSDPGPGARLARVGPSSTEDLRTELGLKRQELKALRSPLERCGVLVARSIAMTSGRCDADADAARGGGGHRQDTDLSRWDQAYRPQPPALPASAAPPTSDRTGSATRTVSSASTAPAASAAPREAFSDLLVAAVRAAVVAPEPELRRWFSWTWYWSDTLVDDLVRAGRLRRLDAHVAGS